MESVIRDSHFREVARVRVDAKKRIGIPKAVQNGEADAYKVFVNKAGQIILDPQVTIPAAEVWLYKNPEALRILQRGLAEAKSGKLVGQGSFSRYAKDNLG